MTSHLRKIKNQFNTDLHSLKSELRYSYFEAFLTSFIVGIAESFFAAFAIEKGMSTIQSGLLLSVPLILAVGLNLFLNHHLKKLFVSRQVKRNVLLQVFSLTGLLAFALSPTPDSFFSFSVLLVLYSIYWYGHFSSLPAWNLWISELLQAEKGTHYFTLRTRLVQAGIISGLILGGALLQKYHNHFSLLFTAALAGLLLKFYSYKKHEHSQSVMFFSFSKMKKIFHSHQSFFISYGLFNGSLFLSSPYITGYLVTDRQVSYFHFMWVTASLFIGKIVMSYFLNLKDNMPNPMRLMTFGAFVAAPLPWLWPYCPNVLAMCALHFTSGLAWALWEIGLSLIFFKNIAAKDKLETITLYNTIGISSQMIGTILGALLIKFTFNYDYTLVFAFAGVIRILCALPFQKNKALMINQSPEIKKAS